MAPLRNRLGDQRGVTLIEVLVSAFILALGIGVSITTFAQAGKTTHSATRLEQAASLAEREIEAIRARPYGNVVLSSKPAASGDGLVPGDSNPNNPKNPNFYVNGDNFRVRQNWNDKTSPLIANEPLWWRAGALPSLLPAEDITVDGLTAHVYRFITERQESCPPRFGFLDPVFTLLDPLLNLLVTNVNDLVNTGLIGSLVTARLNVFCLDDTVPSAETKRVTVAVVLDEPGNGARPTRPVYLSTIITCAKRGAVVGTDEACAG